MKNALIAAIVAAVVAAASGTAATIIVTSKNIKNGTIQAVDISPAAKRALKGNRGARGAAGPRGLQGATGPAGPTGAAGAQGPAGIQTLHGATQTLSVPSGATGDVTAVCPVGQTAVSGGAVFGGLLVMSAATTTGWRVVGFNDLPAPDNLTVVAYCSPNITRTGAP